MQKPLPPVTTATSNNDLNSVIVFNYDKQHPSYHRPKSARSGNLLMGLESEENVGWATLKMRPLRRLLNNRIFVFRAICVLTLIVLITWIVHQSMSPYKIIFGKEQSIQEKLIAGDLKSNFKIMNSIRGRNREILEMFKGGGHSSPSDIEFPVRSPEWFSKTCFGSRENLGRSIQDVAEKLQQLQITASDECYVVQLVFERIFEMEVMDAPVQLPSEFKPKVMGWLGNDTRLFNQVSSQKVFKIMNKGNNEETVFNPLRSKRPSSKSNVNPLEYIANLSKTTGETCDFCNYRKYTAEDVFGRIENTFTATASNTFKLAVFHGLFFPQSHNPLNISKEAIEELFTKTALEWFHAAHGSKPSMRFPTLLWDVLPHAGASQVHPHVHGILNQNHYSGQMEDFHAISQNYFKKYSRSYWTDLILVHWALGLSQQFGDAIAIVPLFARKDHEYLLLSKKVNSDFSDLVYKVLEAYVHELEVFCFSSGGAYPYMEAIGKHYAKNYAQPGLPVMFRFGSRGSCTSLTSDVSSLDLYMVVNQF